MRLWREVDLFDSGVLDLGLGHVADPSLVSAAFEPLLAGPIYLVIAAIYSWQPGGQPAPGYCTIVL